MKKACCPRGRLSRETSMMHAMIFAAALFSLTAAQPPSIPSSPPLGWFLGVSLAKLFIDLPA